MDTRLISSIRILPSSKTTFKTETDFRFFIENTMINRGGYYYFPNAMMNCPNNTLVLFQYSAKIRAIGLLIERDKKKRINEQGEEHAGYYRFDINSLKYLDAPIDKDMMKAVCPEFSGFNQTKQIIALEYLNPIIDLLLRTNNIIISKTPMAMIEIINNEKRKNDSIFFRKT